ncbi:hypothetical protein KHC33_11410 [Methanospirillum sp. J.3.6.1-F.2.7.3]|jgi:DNA-binding transcriptional regulator YhcF (GntR family)|uniref:Uncharacterized protein n=2 Tax=Methanospirillum TaxID=2202 RepID=A0A8E7EID1_9EURY|nr:MULTISPECIES: hypothetical protein [Methanospirillum]MDX8551537.1 hypothetical protein [Methanospirillum hungatei]NLW76690.1 hypothetical protein [Methanomicrobiales archaeon]QVV87944.1 hypothetical protein KHC33_11410 [Methanospirillum sp. J.3.6.1-F.2.7.3]QXO95418.1 hypothetical protein KSK55_03170 [Methanospirillum hungatei]
MPSLSIEGLFESAVKIFLFEDNAITLTFSKDGIHIRFPTTRRLAEYLEVPHYYILPYFAMMEEQELVTRAERVGILTTNKGSSKLVCVMQELHPEESKALLGDQVFQEIVRITRK